MVLLLLLLLKVVIDQHRIIRCHTATRVHGHRRRRRRRLLLER